MPAKLVLSDTELNKIITDYESGESLRFMAKKYKRSRNTLAKILKEKDVQIRDNTINSRKYNHDEDYFENIDNEHKAYWFGFICADGFIESKRIHNSQKFGITLNSIDKEHLEKFKKDINATNPIKEYRGSGYNPDGMFSKIMLTSQKTVDDLKKHGCIEHKSLTLKFPEIREDLLPHFIRGYFDGDGSLNKSKGYKGKCEYSVQFTGTKEFLEKLMEIFNKNLKLYYHNNAYELTIGGSEQVKRITKYMYENSTVYLDRKYEKYLEMLKYVEKQG